MSSFIIDDSPVAGSTQNHNPEPAAFTSHVEPVVHGLSEEEILDPNEVIVTISDTKTPVVVLFGARTSGKTMTLIRLAKYLQGQGYNIVPDPIFRPDRDRHYQRMCQEFSQMIHSDYAASGNDVISFMLVKVVSPSGRTLCQILEAPGEHYFDADIPDRPFPSYIQKVCSIPNRRSWIFIVEENWGGTQGVRDLYAQKIQRMQRLMNARDRVIFTCHKVDKSAHFRPDGRPDERQIFQNIKFQYPHIFDPYVNRNPITKLFAPYNFDFVPFSAGAFTATNSGRQVYNAGPDHYPARLWEAIKSNI